MRGRKHIVGNAIFAFLYLALLYPLAGRAQKVSSSFNTSSFLNFSTQSAGSSPEPAEPAEAGPANSYERPWSNNHQESDAGLGDVLSSVVQRKWMSAAGAYAFAAAPVFYSAGLNAAEAGDWDSALSGAIAAHLNRSNTTDLRLSSDLDFYGERRQTGAGGAPGGQSFTMEWQVAHLLPSRFGVMEVATGGYQQRLVSFPAYANGPLTDVLLGYSASSIGFETSVTLPEKNLALSFRYGTEHIGPNKARVALFELSWTW